MKNIKSYATIAKYLVIFLLIVIIVGCLYFDYMVAPISNDKTGSNFTVETGDTYSSVATKLKNAGFIRSEKFFKIYIKLTNANNLEAGIFTISKSMGLKEIVSILDGGYAHNPNVIRITFKENITMWDLAKLIASKTNNKESDVYNKLKDTTYIDSLIKTYSFLSSDIQNSKIYYPLEGYLEPNTYEFASKDVSVDEIFRVLLNERAKTISKYQDQINKSGYSVHQILTLASVVEAESGNVSEMNNVASVFYNRLKIKMPLGSDVTTYYAEKLDMKDRDLTSKEVADCNAYNTRATCMGGKLPAGPIGNPSDAAIAAVLNPSTTSYYYFVADKNGKIYYSKTLAEHNSTIAKLKAAGVWYEY